MPQSVRALADGPRLFLCLQHIIRPGPRPGTEGREATCQVFSVDEAAYLRLVRGETLGIRASAARFALACASLPYGAAVQLRGLAYARGWKPTHRAGIPVVSVGNLTLGGTGKTPMVAWIAQNLRDRGLRVVILSRGYGETSGLNDEGRVLEENLPDVPHLQGRDRVLLARTAEEELESQVAVLDDGFQHRRLARDLDLVLLDALEPFGTGRLFPRGLLREPVGALKRADIVVLSRADLVDQETRATIRAHAERRAGPVKWVEARHAPSDLVDAEGVSTALENLGSSRVAAFCGIGNPESFRRTLENLGANLVAFRAFPDHHPYSRADVESLAGWARSTGAELALTTQKDFVKLRTQALGTVPLRAVRIRLEILAGGDVLEQGLQSVAQRVMTDSPPLGAS